MSGFIIKETAKRIRDCRKAKGISIAENAIDYYNRRSDHK